MKIIILVLDLQTFKTGFLLLIKIERQNVCLLLLDMVLFYYFVPYGNAYSRHYKSVSHQLYQQMQQRGIRLTRLQGMLQ